MFPDLVVGVAGSIMGGAAFKILEIGPYGFWWILGVSVGGASLSLLLIMVFYERRLCV